ncbi:hypothetical protein [Streptomyces sp. ms184]|uniref:hypothetical protein n=1 Tax=Streptomyces sp. ms184 TaxID=1827974 RepID=UPI00117F72ED|nr:hypothetical protein [Streptomyces sp. ms184]
MQSAGAKRDAADDLLEAERPEETALRPGNENVHILVEAERIAADRKEDGSPEAQDEKVAAALEAAQLREQAARAGAAPRRPSPAAPGSCPAGRPLPPARQRTAPAGPLQHGHQRPHRLLHVRNVPGLRNELLRPDAELRSQVNPSASAGRRPCSTSATTKGRLVPHPLQLGLQRAYVVALAVPVLLVVLVAQNRDSVALSAMPAQPTTEPCSQPEA